MAADKVTHVVLVSSPGLGHLIPMIELAKRIVNKHNFKATVLAVTSQTSHAETQILNSAHCHVIDVPSPDITNLVHPNDRMVTRLCVMMGESRPAIKNILSQITPRPSALIVDIFSTDSIPLARELNILSYVYVASNAWFLALILYSPVLDQQIQGEYVHQKQPLKIPGCSPVRPDDLAHPMLDRNNREYKEYLTTVAKIPQSDGVLVNTWEELQHETLEAMREGGLLSQALNINIPVYAVGPLVRQPESDTSSVTRSLLTWLDEQPSESVVYVSFGSGGTLSCEQMTELAWGLELSERRFIWVVRAPTEKAADAAFFTTGSGVGDGDDNDELAKYLPEGFVSRTRGLGLLVREWAQQVNILSHDSIGGFVSHCGWGSTLESLTNGVPLVAWPLYAEQRMNATLLAEELGLAVWPEALPAKKVVRREEIARMVRAVIPGDQSVEGNRVRERVKEMQRSGVNALSEGGSSNLALSQVAKTIAGAQK